MLKSFSLGVVLWGAVLLLIVVHTAFSILLTFKMRGATKFEYDPVDPTKVKTKGDELAAFYGNNKYYAYGTNVIGLTSAMIVVTLLYVT